ncbi:putative Histidine kinase [Candidatus Promineifilum breve]|uniref:histidine kinase n=1 Tax=Candidatus Promineifilum breve TaxID=1806508 RepID=A0A160T6L4_9CHLR|nr:ATP-binding protein [Candidatus Promineifilum breve]CUS04908.2 putative Histidine kinase [Candidatus Promineifilum breve]
MPRTLRSRLLWSYVAVILAALLIVGVALIAFSSVSDARLLPSLERLSAISRTNQRELLQLWESGAGGDELQGLLFTTSEQADVRILVVDTEAEQIVFDTNTGDDWVGDELTSIERPQSLVLTNGGRDSIFGSFVHTNGSRWLVFAEPHPALGRALIFYAQAEPTAGEFFNEYFLRPLVYAGGLALLLALLLALIIARSVARPLGTMAGAAEAIARGDYDQRVPPQGPDEVQRVAGSFNSMAAQVKATQQAQRDFVANVSHDLKTPLTAISGWSQALLDGAAEAPDERQRAAETIYNEAGRMERMVNELLDLARMESGQLQLKMRPVDLSQLLTDVHHSQLPRARAKDIELTLDAAIPLPTMGDPDRLTQIFTNLADNALAYTPAGGRVHLATRVAGGSVEGIVTDSGPGIPAEELPRVFERFYRLEKSRARGENGRGSGLGLAIVYELVTAHGGQISVSSEVGRGSAFIVRLPGNPQT